MFVTVVLCMPHLVLTAAPEYERVFIQETVAHYPAPEGLGAADRIVFEDGRVIVGAGGTCFALTDGVWTPWDGEAGDSEDAGRALDVPLPSGAGPANCAVETSTRYAVGTDAGLYWRAKDAETWERALPADARYSWALRRVRALAADDGGRLWFGAEQGIGVWDGAAWELYAGKDGVPYNHFTCATAGGDGAMWFGTERGAIRAHGGRFAYRHGRRWLLDGRVTAMAVDPSGGDAWIATQGGVSVIRRRPMTLEQKAAYFIEQTEQRHVRDGFVCDARLETRFDVGSWTPKISDNDGMYTAKYGAAHAFRYAVTKDPGAKAIAVRCMKACKWLVDITGTGMPARVIIPSDWPEPVNEQYGPEYNEARRKTDPLWKLITPRFVPTEDGKYFWKCDTSSDELAGHFFYYGVFYDLVAETEAEKALVRDACRAVIDHLIDNGFLLRDHDGQPTRWGNHSPEYVDSAWGWEQRGLNSMMMLSYLAVAHHVLGDAKYAETARMLREQHHYHINAMLPKMFFPPDYVVPWDNNLCLQSMYGLMNYTDDPELLLLYRLALEHAWLHISKQKNAFWNTLYAAGRQRFRAVADTGVYKTGAVFPELGPYAQFTATQLRLGNARVQDTLETLRGIPLDLIGYRMDNAHRLDVVQDPTPGQSPGVGWHFDGRAVPIEERGHVRLDRDAFALDACEDDGWAEHEGTFFLLPYYMARYHGVIE